ncbi:LisH domain-containing protein ARMC9 [Fasciola hepatica]|uniref:LisH domain-containing protein ARMC9 n=1 Tax=Fasciola hepatica TaxID=6192 RepID=A0A4E0RH90_FASHE|nr:LisH domain-containing protein ARMC9 [Fasciola hepatica]
MNFEKNQGEENVLDLMQQFFEHYQFRDTLAFFKSESRLFQGVPEQEWRPLNEFRQKLEIIKMLDCGDKRSAFKALEDILPENILNSRDYQRLEFELNLYLATATWDEASAEQRTQSLQEFRHYLETKGALLSQSTDLLPYYALPYAPNPKEHPIYQQLFKEPWRKSVTFRLSTLIDSTISPNRINPPRLVKLLTEHTTKRDKAMRQLSNELADAEKRASQAQRRFARLQMDYQTLISVSADLLDALENSLKGIKLEDGLMQRIYTRLVNSQDRGQKTGSTTSSLHESIKSKNQFDQSANGSAILTAAWNEKNEIPLFDLDFTKIKRDIFRIDDRKKCYLLQALRWRLTKSTVHQREYCLTSFVRQDLLDLTTVGPAGDVSPEKAPLLACLRAQHHRVREYMARFLNALASLCRGRAYLGQNPIVVKLLIAELIGEKDESVTRENLVGALQKMSLRRTMQTLMINMSVIPWVVGLLENIDNLSDYTMEYSVALCMNLCLRTSGKRNCLLISKRILKVLIELLNCANLDIVPYVNGALYSILILPEMRKVANQMNLQTVLEGFVRPEQPDMNRQFEFIIRRLRSNESPSAEESDDEIDDDDDEEDAPTLESDLDRQDLPPPDPSDLKSLTGPEAILRDPRLWVGEGLLKFQYAVEPTVRGEANGGVDWCKPMLSRDNETRMSTCSVKSTSVLRRPATPSQRSARVSVSDSRPSTASKFGLATLAQSFSEDTTPRASIQLDSDQLRNALSDLQRQQEKSQASQHSTQPSLSETPRGVSQKPARSSVSSKGNRPSVGSKRSAFESRPKIPRTPEASSPVHKKTSACQSPDSTVSSTQSSRASEQDEDQNTPKNSRSLSRSNNQPTLGQESTQKLGKDDDEEEEEEQDRTETIQDTTSK